MLKRFVNHDLAYDSLNEEYIDDVNWLYLGDGTASSSIKTNNINRGDILVNAQIVLAGNKLRGVSFIGCVFPNSAEFSFFDCEFYGCIFLGAVELLVCDSKVSRTEFRAHADLSFYSCSLEDVSTSATGVVLVDTSQQTNTHWGSLEVTVL